MNNQSRDIDRAIQALQALKARTRPAAIMTMGRQIESYEQHKDVAREAAQIVIDFMTEICASAAELGNDDDSAAIRETLRVMIMDALDEVFVTADLWADEVREEYGLEAA